LAAGGGATLVQTGDVVDRGPDTRYLLDYLSELARQAATGVRGGGDHPVARFCPPFWLWGRGL